MNMTAYAKGFGESAVASREGGCPDDHDDWNRDCIVFIVPS